MDTNAKLERIASSEEFERMDVAASHAIGEQRAAIVADAATQTRQLEKDHEAARRQRDDGEPAWLEAQTRFEQLDNKRTECDVLISNLGQWLHRVGTTAKKRLAESCPPQIDEFIRQCQNEDRSIRQGEGMTRRITPQRIWDQLSAKFYVFCVERLRKSPRQCRFPNSYKTLYSHDAWS